VAVKSSASIKDDRMLQALLFAIGIHLVIIFGLGFSIDFPTDITRATAVTFALTPAEQVPDEAVHVAAFNQQGDREESATELLYPGASLSIMEAPQQNADTRENPMAKQLAEQLESLQREVDALSGEQQPQGNPRAGAVPARRALDADYLLRWRRRVEQVGNALYRRVTARHGSGDVRLLVVVAADGTLERTRVITTSGKPELDQAAIDTVRRAAPFPAFSPELRAQTERLEIIRTWQFRHQEEG
jgi:protein TonB